MKSWTILKYEFSYLCGRVSTGLYLFVLLAFTLVMNGITTPGDGVYPNNTFYLTTMGVVGGLIWLMMGAAIAGEAAARDVQTRMYPLTYTSPVTRLSYLGGRFLAAFGLNALLVLALPVGMLLSFYLPGMKEGDLLPLRPWAYGNVYFLILLPMAFVATALQFAFAALSGRVMSSYVASLLLALVAQVLAITMAQAFGNWNLVTLLDPVGVSGIVGSELQTWTPTEKNTRLITLTGPFLWNRILWLSIAVGALGLTYRRFRFTNPETNGGPSRYKRSNFPVEGSAGNAISSITAISVSPVSRSFGFTTCVQQALSIARSSFGKLAGSPLGLTVVGAIALISALFGDRIMTQFGIPLLPTTPQVVDYLTAPLGSVNTPLVVIPLLMLYFTGELVWREREAGISDVADAAPVPEWVVLIGKFTGAGLLLFVWMALLLAGGIGMQLGMGYEHLEIGLYLQALFGLQLVDYLLFTLLAMVVHVVVNQKYVGYLLGLIVYLFIAFPSHFGIEHNLLIFGSDPGWSYTAMRGFGSTLGPWLWFKAYWIAWALMLAVVARLLWVRGWEQGWKYRLQTARRRFTGLTRWVSLIAMGLIATLGSFILYNTNGLNEYLTASDINEQKAEYERRYGRYRNAPQPQLTATRLDVELYPERQQVDIQATYTLVNKDTVALDTIHIASASDVVPQKVRFSRPATSVLTDDALNYHIYALAQPLRPGDSLQLHLAIHYQQRGFQENGNDALVIANGSYFTNFDLLPSIGYQPYRELKDPVLRKKYKLPPRPALPSLYDWEARSKPLSMDQTTLDITVGTAKREVAVAPGRLIRTWMKGDRRYFHYRTDGPIGAEYSILSGKYALRETRWKEIVIRIYYHPDHAQKNIERMLRSVTASLTHYTEQFGPYPYGHFTLVERARSGGGASADASIVYYDETYALMQPDDGPNGFDLPFYILAHEVAHQWWGLARLTPAHVEGAGVLIEGLAVYSGMQVLERQYGEGHLRKYVSYLHSFYAIPRSLATAPLLRANEEFLYYRKGGLAMYVLSRYVGEEKVNGALRRLLRGHGSSKRHLPTSLDLYTNLQQVTPDSLQYLLHDLFEKNIYWRLKTEKMAVVPTSTGHWQVTLRIRAQKVVVDSTGLEREVPMNDWLEIGLYEENKGPEAPLYLRLHRIRSGEQTIKVTLPHQPKSGGIDPNYLMIDLRLDDNIR